MGEGGWEVLPGGSGVSHFPVRSTSMLPSCPGLAGGEEEGCMQASGGDFTPADLLLVLGWHTHALTHTHLRIRSRRHDPFLCLTTRTAREKKQSRE